MIIGRGWRMTEASRGDAVDIDSYIFIVPRGPRLDLRTSCRPSPALMLTLRASPRRYRGTESLANTNMYRRRGASPCSSSLRED